MSRPILADAFAHHVWATIHLLDACAALEPEQLDATAAGTYGSIVDTLRHLVGSDTGYLFVLSGGRVEAIDEDREASMSLADLRATMVADGASWSDLVTGDLDPDLDVVRHRDDGSESHAPLGIRLAQVLHHGSDHRSQVCTALTNIGIEPPDIDAWAFADAEGRLRVVPAAS